MTIAANPFDPALDEPYTVDFNKLDVDEQFVLANAELHFRSDRDCNLQDLFWAWHDRPYARSIRVRLAAPIYTQHGISEEPVDEVMPLVVRFFPGYQETIYGTESGVVVSKRLFAPTGSSYDRSVLWMLECQAEGDRLLRIEIDIDWGTPLDQRMVDGLLVAQRNPGEATGVHDQQNAESTRVFGTDGGRPDQVSFPDKQHARLVYHVLVAGQVDLPLILAVSDVGEQIAWSGFLGQRDIARAFKRSQDVWQRVSRRGRLWTPCPALNQAVQHSKEDAVQNIRRLRSGPAPANRQIAAVPALVDTFDTFEMAHSRSLLDHMQRLAVRTEGRLPERFPMMPADEADASCCVKVETVGAYLHALANHMAHHPGLTYLGDHADAIQYCANVLLDEDTSSGGKASGPTSEPNRLSQQDLKQQRRIVLYVAARLAGLLGDEENEARWMRAANRVPVSGGGQERMPNEDWRGGSDVQTPIYDWERLDKLVGRSQGVIPAPGAASAGEAVWHGCGVSVQGDELVVSPHWPLEWGWWALMELPITVPGGHPRGSDTDQPSMLSLLWDGESLHSTLPVRFEGNVVEHREIRTEGSTADNFSLRFELTGDGKGRIFRPIFYEAESWQRRQSVNGVWLD